MNTLADVLLAALLLAALALGGETPPRVLSFSLSETPTQLTKLFGSPPNVVRAQGYRLLQYHDGEDNHASHSCDGVFEWEVYLDQTETVQSITWNLPEPVKTSTLFPEQVAFVPSPMPAVGVLLRRLSGDRFLIASASAGRQIEISQVTVMRAAAVSHFLPWLDAHLQQEPKNR